MCAEGGLNFHNYYNAPQSLNKLHSRATHYYRMGRKFTLRSVKKYRRAASSLPVSIPLTSANVVSAAATLCTVLSPLRITIPREMLPPFTLANLQTSLQNSDFIPPGKFVWYIIAMQLIMLCTIKSGRWICVRQGSLLYIRP